MRVLLTSVEYPPRPGGIGVSCRRLATGLRLAGDKVVVVACDYGEGLAPDCEEVRVEIQDGIAVHWLPPRLTSGEGFARAMNYVLPLVQSFRPTIVHSYTPIPAGYLGVRCASYADVPHVVSNRGADVTQFSLMWPTGTRLVYENSDAILSVSSSFHRYIELVSGRADTEMVANSITPDIYDSETVSTRSAREALSLDQDAITLGTLSKFRWKKGLDYLEEVLIQVGKSSLGDLQFVLGGIFDEELCARLRTVFEDTSSSARTRKLVTYSQPNRDDVRMLMSAMDLFISTSCREGMPNTLIESVACGTPVAATAVDGQIDFLEGSGVGVLLHRFDPQVGAQQIIDLCEDQKRLDKMASGCRSLVADSYLQQHEVEKIRNVYQRVIAQRSRSRESPNKKTAA